ncbi:MAG: hypothetical protein JWN74_3273 [Acidobacteriaceae bacterium]|nr:hypothetical protein [Acidobacteriaceae bacterium]
MEPIDIRFGGGASHTTLHPLVAFALFGAIVLTFVLPRKYVVVPWLLTVFLTPFGQVVVLSGVHFTVYRIAVVCGLVRLAITKFPARTGRLAGGFSAVDTAFMFCALFSFMSFSVQWMEWQAVIKSLGSLLDGLGGYFVLRFLIRDMRDVQRTIKVLAAVAIVLAICMTNEQLTRENVFGLLGGVAFNVPVRDGSARAMGSFQVYLTAGVFGATLLPLFISLCSDVKDRLVGYLGIAGASIMVLTSNSSTPLLAYAAGIVGLCFWPLRKRMRVFWWSLVLILVSVHLSMKAPVWALIQRVDLTGSSSGFHRYMLVEQCMRHLGDWWLVGNRNYNDWGSDMWDLSNQYVGCAVTGGLATLVTFILVISRSFGRLGTARRLVNNDRKREWSIWCLCAALLSHVVAYFGVNYFDQMQVAWYALLAMISVAASEAALSRRCKVREALALNGNEWTAVNSSLLETNP